MDKFVSDALRTELKRMFRNKKYDEYYFSTDDGDAFKVQYQPDIVYDLYAAGHGYLGSVNVEIKTDGDADNVIRFFDGLINNYIEEQKSKKTKDLSKVHNDICKVIGEWDRTRSTLIVPSDPRQYLMKIKEIIDNFEDGD